MSSELRAIETRYFGRLFRSRLEARWAVAFNALQVRWTYEPQGYVLGNADYLCDFYLPLQAAWIEVKGELDNPDRYFALHKATALAARSNRRVLITIGDLPYPYPTIETHPESMLCVYPNGDQDFPYWLCACPACGFVGVEYAGRADRLPCRCLSEQEACCSPRTYTSRRFQDAYEAGLSARFEHGQSG